MLPMRLSALAAIISVVLTFVYPQQLTIHVNTTLRIFGVITLFVCDLAMIWALTTLGDMWTVYVCRLEEHKLIKSGPYKYVRHPMYALLCIFCTGFIFATGNWLVFMFLAINVLAATLRVREEERLLVSQFGEEYIEYMKTTGAFCCIAGVCDCGIDINEERELLLPKSAQETTLNESI